MKKYLMILIANFLFCYVAAQAPQASQPIDVALLERQLELMQDLNTRMAASYDRTLTVITILLGASGLIGLFIVNRSVQDIKSTVDQLVQKEVNKHLSASIKGRIEHLERVVEREEVLGWTNVDYYRPNNQSAGLPEEYQLLVDRGFNRVTPCLRPENIDISSDILVVDLTAQSLEEKFVTEQIDSALRRKGGDCVLVFYAQKQFQAINDLREKIVYYNVANMPVRLVGACVDAAHVAYSLKHRNE